MEVWCAGVTARCAPTVLPALLILGLVPVTACRDSVPADEPVAREDPSPSVVLTEVTLYFTDTEELQVADCGAVLAARRVVPDSLATPTHVLRLLLDGVGVSERSAGMSSQFDPAPAIGADRPLADYLLGIEVRDGTAFLDFAPGALPYLNNAACLQAAVKQPIIRTLQEFPEIDRVVFRIGGEPFEDWDA
jgi:hypothetical protein